MKRRNFIKSCLVSAIGLPFISHGVDFSSSDPVHSLISVHPILEQTYELLSIEELRQHNIRASHYSGNVIYKDGKFGHERERVGNEISDPFVVKAYRIHCLPRIWSTNKQDIFPVIRKINIDQVIAEVKQHMEYVSFVGYAKTTNEYNEQFYFPIKRGLTKPRYNIYREQMEDYLLIN